MSKRILVVEDQADNRRILQDLLTTAGYEIILAENGQEALEVVARERPNLILMDIQLPLLDGYEATRRIKADPVLRAIPIIVITSYALSGDESKAKAAGCDAYVAKPLVHELCLRKFVNICHDRDQQALTCTIRRASLSPTTTRRTETS
jgi:two-component system, cell cycle response regulator DivK